MTIYRGPNLSVVLPTYNRSQCIEHSILSVLRQTYKNFELIVVDDGSTDQTADRIQRLRDPRIRYIAHTKRKGANAARNSGIRAARAPYIAFQDSDDEWMPDKLAMQLAGIKESGHTARVSFSAHWRIRGREVVYIPKPSRRLRAGPRDFHAELLYGNFITTASLLVEKELLYQVGLFDESIPRFQDWELVLRLSRHSAFVFVDKPLVRCFVRPDSISKQSSLISKSMEMIMQKHQPKFERHRVAKALQLLNLGIYSFLDRDFRNLIRYWSKAWTLDGLVPIHLFAAIWRVFTQTTTNHVGQMNSR
jgi:glycosyltransferase involved in cell wall biosynthesis